MAVIELSHSILLRSVSTRGLMKNPCEDIKERIGLERYFLTLSLHRIQIEVLN